MIVFVIEVIVRVFVVVVAVGGVGGLVVAGVAEAVIYIGEVILSILQKFSSKE